MVAASGAIGRDSKPEAPVIQVMVKHAVVSLRPLTLLHIAIFLLSALALLFEFAQTRLFSATLDYHLTFLVLSGALLGVGAGAACSAALDGRKVRPTLAQLAFGAAAATLIALLVETRIDPITDGMIAAASAGYLLGVLPILCVSWVVVRALRETPTSSGSLYAADLAGAAVGALLGYLAIGALGDQGLYGLAAASALVATALLAIDLRRLGRGLLVVGAVAVVVVLSAFGEVIARPLPGVWKAPEAGLIQDAARWDPLARIDVKHTGDGGNASQYAFLIDPTFTGPRPPALAMQLDLGALTPIVAGGPKTDLSVFDASILAAPYELAPRPSVLIVGPGGGVDILVALEHGATNVSAVEVNRTEVTLMRGQFADYSGGVYLDPRVHVIEDEARSFIRRSNDAYDVIPITVVDSFAALGAGAYALTENYLYTTDAMSDYLRHLQPNGVAAISRWYRDPPLEMQRLMSVAEDSLSRLGSADPKRSIAVVRYRNFGLVLIRREPYSAEDMSRLHAFAAAHGFEIAFDPLAPAGPLSVPPSDAPPTDDHPFFFDNVPLSQVLSGAAPLPYGYAVLVVTLIVSSALAAGAVLLPTYPAARRASRRLVPPGSLVAASIGLGFIGAEVVMLQRLTLYLGQPSLALSIGLAGLLVGASSGSALSNRLPGGIRLSAIGSGLGLLLVLLLLPLVADGTLAAPLAVRVLISAIAAYLVGLPLGTVFPRLIRDVSEMDPSLVNWVWAANGTASVIGATVATVVALTSGFTALGLLACACYFVVAVRPSTHRADDDRIALTS